MLRPRRTPPIRAVWRRHAGPQGQPPGSLAVDPAEVDEGLKEAWAEVFQETEMDGGAERRARFFDKYGHYIHSAPERPCEPITAEQLRRRCCAAKPSACGPDQLAVVDLKWLPLEAYERLAQLLKAIECGEPGLSR